MVQEELHKLVSLLTLLLLLLLLLLYVTLHLVLLFVYKLPIKVFCQVKMLILNINVSCHGC
jgi:hypothetical protein